MRLTRVFGESVEDTLETMRDASGESNAARARRTKAVPSANETWIVVCVQKLVPALCAGEGRSVLAQER